MKIKDSLQKTGNVGHNSLMPKTFYPTWKGNRNISMLLYLINKYAHAVCNMKYISLRNDISYFI